MKLDSAGTCHLTYCTNIHAGETWAEVRENLGRYLTAVRERLVPSGMFGVGLRLSAIAAADPPIEVLFIGCGVRAERLPGAVREALKERAIIVDGMETGAACRTYNVLLAEERRVAAALIAI